jgi:hypothetical protein
MDCYLALQMKTWCVRPIKGVGSVVDKNRQLESLHWHPARVDDDGVVTNLECRSIFQCPWSADADPDCHYFFQFPGEEVRCD